MKSKYNLPLISFYRHLQHPFTSSSASQRLVSYASYFPHETDRVQWIRSLFLDLPDAEPLPIGNLDVFLQWLLPEDDSPAHVRQRLFPNAEQHFVRGFRPELQFLCPSIRPALAEWQSWPAWWIWRIWRWVIPRVSIHVCNGITYEWWRKATRTSTRLVIWIHGITVDPSATLPPFPPDTAVLLIHLPFVQLGRNVAVDSGYPNPAEFRTTFYRMVRHCPLPITLCAHSWGSYIIPWLTPFPREMHIEQVHLFEPVSTTFLSPPVTYEMCYRWPRTLEEWIIKWLIRNDAGIDRAIRSVDWSTHVLLPSDVGAIPVTIWAMTGDALLDASLLTQIVAGQTHWRLHWFEGGNHGNVMSRLPPDWMERTSSTGIGTGVMSCRSVRNSCTQSQ